VEFKNKKSWDCFRYMQAGTDSQLRRRPFPQISGGANKKEARGESKKAASYTVLPASGEATVAERP